MASPTCCFFIERRLGCIILAVLTLIGNGLELFRSPDWTMTTTRVMFMLAAVLLLVGIFLDHRQLMLAFLAVNVLAIVCFVIVFLSGLIGGELYKNWTDIASAIIITALESYWVFVVFSLYKDMETGLPR